ncbi:MAG: class I SAM-dependent methyltransferase, partial [Lachnospiraceae bacterium]|nr:class I SAM-dependent methyltransferase [Lachnospiraceae bacterium]
EYDLTLFIKREDGLYERAEETHLQRGIEKEDIENLARKSGLEVMLIADSDTDGEVREETERIYAVFKKPESK